MARFFIFIISLSIFSFSLKAESLDVTAVKIFSHSPEFLSENYSLESALATSKTASNLPDPEISGEYLVAPADETDRWGAELSWGIEWPGVYGARAKEASGAVSTFELDLYARRAERFAELKDLLLDYIRCQQKLDILQQLSNNNDSIFRLAENAAKGGEITLLDLNKVKLEYANIRVAKAALMDEEAEVVAQLAQIYGGDCRSLLESMECVFPPVIIPSQEEILSINETAPKVLAVKAEAEKSRLSKKVAKMEALPSLSVGYKHAFEDGFHFNGATLGISLPIFSSRGKQKAAKASILEAESKAEAVAQEIEAETAVSLKRLMLLKQQIEEIEPIILDADYNSLLLKAYKGGALTLLEYLSDRNYFATAAMELVNLRHNAAKAQAQIEQYLNLPTFLQ